MITLKKYQEKSLEILKKYLERARLAGAKDAYDKIQKERYGENEPYKPYGSLKGLEESPYICLRLPTGGGKTLLSAHSIKLAGETYIENEYPITLWLVPTNIIKLQTLETLKNPGHANYQVLENAFNGKFRVFDIADFRQIRPQDIAGNAVIIVSTFAALRVDKTEGRKVYDHDENLEPHFSKIPSHFENMERDEESGQIKFSFANLLNFHKPLIIVDEAHNAKSDLSIEVLNRVNSACIIEYTATPAKNSNVIYSVSAAELKAEEMIKLPIMLSEHNSPQSAITTAIQTRKKLEDIARTDKDYIRPIVLFQAEDKGKEMTVEILEKYLIENEGIDRGQIAIATGEQKELDTINLFDPNCKICYVITVQALKEGWDCSFAYILCSVAKVQSKTATEQLLGRVLRMPYANLRKSPELNKAYAHIPSSAWPHAVSGLHDRLVQMGFEQQEAEEFICPQPTLLDEFNQSRKTESLEINLTSSPDLSKLDMIEQNSISVNEESEGVFKVKINNPSKKIIEKLTQTVTDKKDKEEIFLKSKIYLKNQFENLSPAAKGKKFIIPQLCLNFEDGAELAEKELCLDSNGWNLLDYYKPLDKNSFSANEEVKQYEADIEGSKITIKSLGQGQQMSLDGILTEMTEHDLCIWLDIRLRQYDVKQETLLEYLRLTIRDLLLRNDIDMAKLIRGKYILEKVLRGKIDIARKEAYKKGYQQYFFSDKEIATISESEFSFEFDPNNYPANLYYEGPIKFDKHYYSKIGKMNGEESECAQALDRNPLVDFWVRNLERQPSHAFWLPTSTDYFYPDFIAKLKDGRLMVIEYKGGQYKGSDDSEEKELIGKVWAKKSGNIFLMGWKKDDNGLCVYQQINKCIG